MLLIAVSYGTYGDPFTTSTTADPSIDPTDDVACRDYICAEKGLKSQYVDEVLVVDIADGETEPTVLHQYGGQDGFSDQQPKGFDRLVVSKIDLSDEGGVPFPDFAEDEDDSDDEDA